LFFNFARQFGFGGCFLVQEMISVIYYLPSFGEWLLLTHFQSSLHFLCLLIVWH
jgi:hypothetical protein